VKDMLDRLVHLQNTDEKIVAFQNEEKQMPIQLDEKDSKIRGLEVERGAIQAEVDELSSQLTAVSHELDEVKDQQRRAQARTLAVKTQREYQAVQREGEIARKRRGELDAQNKELLEEKGEVEKGFVDLDAAIAKDRKSLKSDQRKTRERMKKIQKEREDLEKTREVEAGLVDPDLLARYQKVFERYRGKGVVRVEGGVCNGCFMMVPPQLYNQVLEGHSIHQCPNCARIIYVNEA